jgi:hypothetical protein
LEQGKLLTLNLIDYSRPFEPLEPGRYVISLRGDCYAASARFTLPGTEDFRRHGLIDWRVEVEGDHLDLIVHETNVVSILVPDRLASVSVRIVRDGTVVLQQSVSKTTVCPATELPTKSQDEEPRYAPGLCVYAYDEETERDLLCPEGQAYLTFGFDDDESRWVSGRAYELELVQDGATTTCAFQVPLPMPDLEPQGDAKPVSSTFSGLEQEPVRPDCPLFMDDIREPRGVILTGRPARVTARVRSSGTLAFEGSAVLEYSDTIDYCTYGAELELDSVDSAGRATPSEVE